MLFWFVLALGLGCALSVFVRTGAPLPRSSGVLVMLAVAVAAFVPPRSQSVVVPAEVAIGCSVDPATGGVAALASLQAAKGEPPPHVVVVGGGSTLSASLALAAMRAGPRRDDVIAVWNGPLADTVSTSAPAAGHGYTTTPPLPFAPEALSVQAVTAPRAQRPLRLVASVEGAPSALTGRLVADGGAWHQEQRVVLPVAQSATLDLLPVAAGSIAVQFECDVPPHRFVRTGSLAVRAAESVLVLEPSGTVANALAAQGIAVRSAASLPTELVDFDAVVVGLPLTVEAQRLLVGAVEDGLGLFVLGPGLQQDGEPMRSLLPITVLPRTGDGTAPGNGGGDLPEVPPPEPQQAPSGVHADEPQIAPDGPVEVDKHTIAMVFVIDRSGSMGMRVLGGGTKMSYAKTSARQTALALAEGDEVGLITFGDDDQARVELPLCSAVDRVRVEQGIARLAHSNERTYLDNGLVRARELLLQSKCAVRHVVVLTDGEVWDQELVLRKRSNTMRNDGMSVSIVSIIDDGTLATFQGMAERIAKDGGGLFLPVRDPRVVPQLVSAEVVRALDRVGRKPNGAGAPNPANPQPEPRKPEPKPPKPTPPEPTPPEPAAAADSSDRDQGLELLAVANSPLLEPALSTWPRLRAAVPTTGTRTAHVLLVAGPLGSPVLAYGNRGLGRIGVFAADLAGDDAKELRAEESFSARIAQWVTAALRSLPEVESEVLRTAAVEPVAPLPREVALLTAMTGEAPRSIDQLELPPPSAGVAYRSQVPVWALSVAFLLAGLALIEWWSSRRSV